MSDSSSGSVIGNKYRLGPVLGRGGMGVVREASHVRLGTKFAVKLLHEASDQLDRSRFEREALAASALHNRHVVRVFDIGETAEGTPYMVMELLRGRDVMAVYREETSLATERVVDWMIQVCSAMYEAHAAGIVHRDLKPSNLFLAEGGNQELVKVVDFGISKVLSAKELTMQSSFVGTPQYMAPEQLRGESTIDHRADIWAMGVILYRLLSRQYPFHTADDMSPIVAALANLTATPIPLDTYRPDLPAPLLEAIMRTLSRSPADRFADARELALAISPYGTGTVAFEASSDSTRTELLDRLHEATPMFSAAANTMVDPVYELDVVAEPTHVEPVSPPRSRVPLLVAAVVGVLLVAGGVFGVTRTQPEAPVLATAPSAAGPSASVAVYTLPPAEPEPSVAAPVSSSRPARSGKPAAPTPSKEPPAGKSPSLPVHL